MKKRIPVTLALALAAGGCGILDIFEDTPTLRVSVNNRGVMYTWEGEQLTLNNSLVDPAGLAGVEVRVRTGEESRTFDAADMPTGRFDVPETGPAQVEVRLISDGEVVAEGVAEWSLAPNVEWTVELERSPYPIWAGVERDVTTTPNPHACTWFTCHEVWRFEIDEDAANYAGERLWLTVLRYVPGECTGSCER